MRMNRWQIVAGLVVLAAIIGRTAQAAWQPAAQIATDSSLRVRISPIYQEVTVGLEGVADIYIHDAESIYSASVRLSYAPGIIEILDDDPTTAGVQIAPGDIFAGKSWYAVENEADAAIGEIIYGVALSRDEPAGASGGVLLARIHFRALHPGDSTLGFLEAVLGDETGVGLPAQVIPGLVRVVTEVASTPTPTGTPGPTARTILYLDPSYSLHMPGESGGLSAQLVSWDDVAGIEVHLGYDADVLTIADADPGMAGIQVRAGGSFGGASWGVTRNLVEPEDGYITYAAALEGSPAAGLKGGQIFGLEYDALASGAGGFDLLYVAITDGEGNPIAVETAGARVVVGPLTPTPEGPTPTITPSLTPPSEQTIVPPTVPAPPTVGPEPTTPPKPTIGPLKLLLPIVMRSHTP